MLAYLLLADRPQCREQLCDLLWDEGPDDPRGALRWSLSKLRPMMDAGRRRLIADREEVSIDPGSVSVDLHRAQRAYEADVPVAADMEAGLIALREPLLAGLDLPRHERFAVWLASVRAASERVRRSMLHRFVSSVEMTDEERLPWAREWLDADPFNTDAAAQLQTTLRQMGRQDDAKVARRDFADATSEAGLPPPPDMPITAVAVAARLPAHDMVKR